MTDYDHEHFMGSMEVEDAALWITLSIAWIPVTIAHGRLFLTALVIGPMLLWLQMAGQYKVNIDCEDIRVETRY